MGHIAIVEVLISSWVSLEVLRTYSLTMGSWVSMDSRESGGRRWTPSDPEWEKAEDIHREILQVFDFLRLERPREEDRRV